MRNKKYLILYIIRHRKSSGIRSCGRQKARNSLNWRPVAFTSWKISDCYDFRQSSIKDESSIKEKKFQTNSILLKKYYVVLHLYIQFKLKFFFLKVKIQCYLTFSNTTLYMTNYLYLKQWSTQTAHISRGVGKKLGGYKIRLGGCNIDLFY